VGGAHPVTGIQIRGGHQVRLKRYFGAGLLVILPVFITAYVLFFIFRFIDGMWGKLLNVYLKKHYGFTVPGIGIMLGLFTVLVVGFIATNFFGRRIIHALENWVIKFPVIRQIYMPARQIVNSFIDQENGAFKKVVLVEYPSKDLWSIGFLTNDSFEEVQAKVGEELLHVFIATTPSPLTGFLVLVPKRSVRFLDIAVEDGIKLIVSGGIVKP